MLGWDSPSFIRHFISRFYPADVIGVIEPVYYGRMAKSGQDKLACTCFGITVLILALCLRIPNAVVEAVLSFIECCSLSALCIGRLKKIRSQLAVKLRIQMHWIDI